ncbi:hypothetical protein [Paucibacter sp. Y2R2-4]|uniref:hypothetical protein n=1 Tax=Paucibacter sp. Y2R2-4 TaxID=2893553 RepID=UPI0021E42F57|nr:hypothetical protein [Paucibacter sp. Y2R2-4]MCV2350822.1 hypothetical protein [Paucibacter sp. Y2R2-4]
MSISTPSQVAASDPLREITRKQGRSLVVTSFLALAVVWGGFVPGEIQALGIKLTSANQWALILLIASSCTFLLLSYCLCLASDFATWHLAKRASHKHWHTQRARAETQESNLIAQAEFTLHSRTLRIVNLITRHHLRMVLAVHLLAPVSLALLAIGACVVRLAR